MPLTFLSHQAVVLPLKIARPRITSGTALVLGSMSPDVEYFLRGYPTMTLSHTWLGQLTFCLPVTLALFLIVTRVVAQPAAANAPRWGRLRLSEYARIADQPRTASHWAIVAMSSVIGSSSHVLLDRSTDMLGAPPHDAWGARAFWTINVLFWLALAMITLSLMRFIARHDLLRRWSAARGFRHAHVLVASSAQSTYWGFVIIGILTGAALGAAFRRPGFFLHQPATWVHIWLCSVSAGFVALVLASSTWHIMRPKAVPLRESE